MPAVTEGDWVIKVTAVSSLLLLLDCLLWGCQLPHPERPWGKAYDRNRVLLPKASKELRCPLHSPQPCEWAIHSPQSSLQMTAALSKSLPTTSWETWAKTKRKYQLNHSWILDPQKMCEIQNVCCNILLHFRISCYITIGNW